MEIRVPSRALRAFTSLCCEKTAVLHAPNRAQRLSRPHRPCCATGWPASPDCRARRTLRATCASTRDRPWRFVCRAARSGLSHLYAAKKLQFSTRRTVRRGFRARTGRAAQLAGQLRLTAARGGLRERLAHPRRTGHGDLCAEPRAQGFRIFMLRKNCSFPRAEPSAEAFAHAQAVRTTRLPAIPLPAARGSAPAQVVRTTPRGSFPEPPQFPLPFSGNLRYNSFRIGRHPPETHRGG